MIRSVLNIAILVGLLAAIFWLGNLSAYNAWAAGLSVRRNPEAEIIYEGRSNIFFVAALALLVEFLAFVFLWYIRGRKIRRILGQGGAKSSHRN